MQKRTIIVLDVARTLVDWEQGCSLQGNLIFVLSGRPANH